MLFFIEFFYLVALIEASLWNSDLNRPVDQWGILLNKHSTQCQHESHPNHFKKLLQNKQIFFMGDSLTRYQYVNLLSILHTNTWDDDNNEIVDEKLWPSWQDFYLGITLRFGCQMKCDCYRDAKVIYDRENRYYYDRRYNITINYYAWCPPNSQKINPLPTSVPQIINNQCLSTKDWLDNINNGCCRSNASLIENNVLDFVRRIIHPHQPDFLIINQGHWKFPQLRNNNTYFAEFIEVFKASCKALIWKRTTPLCERDAVAIDPPSFIQQLKNFNVIIFDAYEYTKDISYLPKVCWDRLHFNNFVYRELNKLLLCLLTDHRK